MSERDRSKSEGSAEQSRDTDAQSAPTGILQHLVERFGAAGAQRIVQRRLAQRRAARRAPESEAEVHRAAEKGTSGAGGPLPHYEQIQKSFGKHDISHLKAHNDAAAAEGAAAMGAEAFATGDRVAFAATPSLHTAAHEAAHAVQQRGGVQLKGGVGDENDEYERHADAVADEVVRGGSSEALLDRHAGAPAAGAQQNVQRTLAAERKDLKKPEIKPRDGVAIGDGKTAKAPGDDGKFLDGKVQEAPLAAASAVQKPDDVLQLSDTAVQSLPSKPGGPGAKPILEKGFGSNWFKAKHVLLEEQPEKHEASAAKTVGNDKEVRGQLMDKLIAMRHWEAEGVLTHVRDVQLPEDIPAAKPMDAKKRLDWDNSGSGNRTSDVDLALKGTYNRQAIGLFNKAFRMRGWSAEPGIVYDVNVYAQTYLGNEEDVEVKGDKLKAPQMKAPVRAEDKVAADLDQEAWSLVHVGRYMSVGEWNAYKKEATGGLEGEARSKMVAAVMKADTRLQQYRSALQKMREKLGYSAKDDSPEHEMEIANRIYEERLEGIIADEKKLAELQAEAEKQPSEGLTDQIAKLVLTIREKYSESEMFSNESYITDGALNHVVMGLQKGTNASFLKAKRGNDDGSPAKIDLSSEGFLQSFNEQLGDVCKELGRVAENGSDLSHHVYQGGKYFVRMIDAAKGMFKDKIPEVITKMKQYELVRQVGDAAINVKNAAKKAEEKGGTPVDTNKETEEALKIVPGKGSQEKLANLRGAAVELGVAVAKEYKKQQNPTAKVKT